MAVDNVDFEVRQGDFISLVGPSGCGKSTWLRLIAGLQAPTSGQILWQDGEAPELGFVFQEATLLPWATVAANVAMPLRLRGRPKSETDAAVRQSLALVGLSEVGDALPKELSGGMRMRVSIARALALKPRVLLMDEPFGALDEITRQDLNDELLRLCVDANLTVLFVTHSVMEAAFLSNRVAVMQRAPGRLVDVIEVELAWPRKAEDRTDKRFLDEVSHISSSLQKAMDQSGGKTRVGARA